MSNFERPYLQNGWSDPLHVWLWGRVFRLGESNGTISRAIKSRMAGGRHLGKLQRHCAISLRQHGFLVLGLIQLVKVATLVSSFILGATARCVSILRYASDEHTTVNGASHGASVFGPGSLGCRQLTGLSLNPSCWWPVLWSRTIWLQCWPSHPNHDVLRQLSNGFTLYRRRAAACLSLLPCCIISHGTL